MIESLRHAAVHCGADLDLVWVNSEHLDEDMSPLEGVDGIVVPGGFGHRGIEGKVLASRYAREHLIPYLGLCLGMQCAVVDIAREVLDAADANSTEFNAFTSHPVIDLLPEQRDIEEKGGTMRLGVYPCKLTPGTRAAEAYGEPVVYERHRHRFEFNNHYRDDLAAAGVVFSGTSPNGRLVEIIELRDHPFFVGSQFHPSSARDRDAPIRCSARSWPRRRADPKFGEHVHRDSSVAGVPTETTTSGLRPARNAARPRSSLRETARAGPRCTVNSTRLTEALSMTRNRAALAIPAALVVLSGCGMAAASRRGRQRPKTTHCVMRAAARRAASRARHLDRGRLTRASEGRRCRDPRRHVVATVADRRRRRMAGDPHPGGRGGRQDRDQPH